MWRVKHNQQPRPFPIFSRGCLRKSILGGSSQTQVNGKRGEERLVWRQDPAPQHLTLQPSEGRMSAQPHGSLSPPLVLFSYLLCFSHAASWLKEKPVRRLHWLRLLWVRGLWLAWRGLELNRVSVGVKQRLRQSLSSWKKQVRHMLHDMPRMKHVRMHKTGFQIQLQMVLRVYMNQQALCVGKNGRNLSTTLFLKNSFKTLS